MFTFFIGLSISSDDIPIEEVDKIEPIISKHLDDKDEMKAEMIWRQPDDMAMFFIHKNGCLGCDRMVIESFANECVREELKRFILVDLDVTDRPYTEEDLINYGITSMPAIVFSSFEGEIYPLSYSGFLDGDRLCEILKNTHYVGIQ